MLYHIACSLSLAAMAFHPTAEPVRPEPGPQPIAIGVLRASLGEANDELAQAQLKPFAAMIKKQTGSECAFHLVDDVDAMAKAFEDNRIQVAVLQGYEYGWLKGRCDQVRPLVIAVTEQPVQKAVVLVPKVSKAKTAADLRGETVAVPAKMPPIPRFYLRHITDGDPARYFQTVPTANTEEAIEAVLEGKAAATVVCRTAMETFERRKPGRFPRLRVLQESPGFPAAVLAYRPDREREAELEQFRKALLKTADSPEGRQTLALCRLTKFAEIPNDYEIQVGRILKEFPAGNK